MRRAVKALVIGMTAFGVSAVAACGDGGGDTEELQAQLDTISTQLTGMQSRLDYYDESIQRALALNSMTAAYTEDLDGLEAEMLSASAIDPAWSLRAERVLRTMQATVWPDEIQERAHGMEEALNETVTALLVEDLPAAQEHMTTARDLWHEVEHDVYIFGAGPEAEHGHSH